ncbi:MAG: hypothetical protein CL886_01995 [Dehalococcoidia bacterium]|nr:hypothetical protein [Dehalococcoidia bacterium]|tara:strand:+ start:6548 stop:6940 length:393 start_codon:yes stop_codon:yes gene_type:complete
MNDNVNNDAGIPETSYFDWIHYFIRGGGSIRFGSVPEVTDMTLSGFTRKELQDQVQFWLNVAKTGSGESYVDTYPSDFQINNAGNPIWQSKIGECLDKLVSDGVLSHETTTDANQQIDVYQVIGDEYNDP